MEPHDLEQKIGDKFVASLKHFFQLELTNLGRSDEPGDLRAKSADGNEILIQITEAVDESSRLLDQTRRRLEVSITQCSEIKRNYAGCRISFIIPDEVTVGKNYPKLKDLLIVNLIAMGRDIHTLAERKRRVRNFIDEESRLRTYITVERFATRESGSAMIVKAGGGQAITNTNWLLQTIKAKVRKGYAKPSTEFWLLIYSRDVLATEDSYQVSECTDYLAERRHPFTKVWFLFPYANKDLGHLILI